MYHIYSNTISFTSFTNLLPHLNEMPCLVQLHLRRHREAAQQCANYFRGSDLRGDYPSLQRLAPEDFYVCGECIIYIYIYYRRETINSRKWGPQNIWVKVKYYCLEPDGHSFLNGWLSIG